MLRHLVRLSRACATGRLARVAPLLATVASLLVTGVASAASGGADFPIWRR